MAQVFLAVQRGPFASNKLVVIKKLLPGAGADQQLIDMFVDEARIAMRLNHPNVVSTFDFIAEEDELYLTMEFLDGQSLLQTLRKLGRDQVPLDLHIWILTQVLAGLGYAHDLTDFDGTPLGIVHRDVTPSNVILTYAGGVKLVDFGIAKVAGALAVTQSGTMKGKLGYVSPEQCLGRATTARSDLYSVGIMLWEAIAGKRRTVGETPAAIYQARVAGTERSIEEVFPETPAALVRIVKRALASAPENRYETAIEFQRELEDYLAQKPRETFGTHALADFMKRRFGDAITAMHRTIESRIAGASSYELTPSGGSAREVTAMTGSSTSRPRPVPTPFLAPAPAPLAAVAAASPTLVASSARSPVAKVAGAGAVLVVAIGAFLAIRAGQSGPAPAAVTAAHEPARLGVPPAAPSPNAQPVPAPLAPAATTPPVSKGAIPAGAPGRGEYAELHVLVKPQNAKVELFLDGKPLAGNPYAGQWPRDGAKHTLGVTAEGYDPIQRLLTLDRDTRLILKLNRKKTAGPSTVAVIDDAAARARPPVRGPAPPAAPAVKAPAQRPEPVEVEEKPGMDLRHRARPPGAGHHIDEKDPYTP